MLFAISPGVGHLFPTVPLAWALRAAGHEVLVATAAESVAAAIQAGLPVVDTAPAAAIEAIFGVATGPPGDRARRMRERGRRIAEAGADVHELLLRTFGQISAVTAGRPRGWLGSGAPTWLSTLDCKAPGWRWPPRWACRRSSTASTSSGRRTSPAGSCRTWPRRTSGWAWSRGCPGARSSTWRRRR
nr:hypothetical protein [Phytohabitans rumicis]